MYFNILNTLRKTKIRNIITQLKFVAGFTKFVFIKICYVSVTALYYPFYTNVLYVMLFRKKKYTTLIHPNFAHHNFYILSNNLLIILTTRFIAVTILETKIKINPLDASLFNTNINLHQNYFLLKRGSICQLAYYL